MNMFERHLLFDTLLRRHIGFLRAIVCWVCSPWLDRQVDALGSIVAKRCTLRGERRSVRDKGSLDNLRAVQSASWRPALPCRCVQFSPKCKQARTAEPIPPTRQNRPCGRIDSLFRYIHVHALCRCDTKHVFRTARCVCSPNVPLPFHDLVRGKCRQAHPQLTSPIRPPFAL